MKNAMPVGVWEILKNALLLQNVEVHFNEAGTGELFDKVSENFSLHNPIETREGLEYFGDLLCDYQDPQNTYAIEWISYDQSNLVYNKVGVCNDTGRWVAMMQVYDENSNVYPFSITSDGELFLKDIINDLSVMEF